MIEISNGMISINIMKRGVGDRSLILNISSAINLELRFHAQKSKRYL